MLACLDNWVEVTKITHSFNRTSLLMSDYTHRTLRQEDPECHTRDRKFAFLGIRMRRPVLKEIRSLYLQLDPDTEPISVNKSEPRSIPFEIIWHQNYFDFKHLAIRLCQSVYISVLFVCLSVYLSVRLPYLHTLNTVQSLMSRQATWLIALKGPLLFVETNHACNHLCTYSSMHRLIQQYIAPLLANNSSTEDVYWWGVESTIMLIVGLFTNHIYPHISRASIFAFVIITAGVAVVVELKWAVSFIDIRFILKKRARSKICK